VPCPEGLVAKQRSWLVTVGPNPNVGDQPRRSKIAHPVSRAGQGNSVLCQRCSLVFNNVSRLRTVWANRSQPIRRIPTNRRRVCWPARCTSFRAPHYEEPGAHRVAIGASTQGQVRRDPGGNESRYRAACAECEWQPSSIQSGMDSARTEMEPRTMSSLH
jgi:hypothetical protein